MIVLTQWRQRSGLRPKQLGEGGGGEHHSRGEATARSMMTDGIVLLLCFAAMIAER